MLQRMHSLWLLAALAIATSTRASVIVSESRSRLPMSLSTVISDLEAEGLTELSTACLITSRTVTAAERRAVLEQLLGGLGGESDEHVVTASSRAIATAKGLALAQPVLLDEVVQSAVACRGLLIFVPSVTDLSRGEGLLDHLAPAMERLLQWQASKDASTGKSCLVVVCDSQLGAKATEEKLEAAARPILETFTTNNKKQRRHLDDVFGSVLYLTADQVQAALLYQPPTTTTPDDAKALVSRVLAAQDLFAATGRRIIERPLELAAARRLEPAKRRAQEAALRVVQDATDRDGQLVLGFGSLCDAALQQAQESLALAAVRPLQSTQTSRELTASLSRDLESEWMDSFERQLILLEESCFANMKQSMSKLRLGATLALQMQEIAKASIQGFGIESRSLIPKFASGIWRSRAGDAKSALTKKFQDFCRDRLQAAEASGQFKPIPRKGVTIGMHWLLPKPFGNDYRQEPWMVHAMDNLVYVPRRSTKVTEVPEENVAGAGDWRDQIVPSPPGRDILYMQ